MKHTIGSVPYVNVRPLVYWFEKQGADSPVDVVYAVPSLLPDMLQKKRAEAVIVSSFDALSTPGRTISEGSSIASYGAVESVRLFSMVPFNQIETLALDQSSMTSNHLARIILAEKYDLTPETNTKPPIQRDMLKHSDACVLIGDIGMQADGEGLYVLDLGQEWFELTGLPFTWALWTGDDKLTPELVDLLLKSKEWGTSHLDEVIAHVVKDRKWTQADAERYLRTTMNYDLTPDHIKGLEKFRELLVKHKFIADQPMPKIIQATATVAH